MNALLLYYFFAGIRGGAAVADVLVDATGAGQASKPSNSAVSSYYRRDVRRLIVRKGESVGLVVVDGQGIGQKHGAGAAADDVQVLQPVLAGLAGRAGAGRSAVSTRAVGAGVGIHPPAVMPVLALAGPAVRRHDDRRRALINAAVAASVSGVTTSRRRPARFEQDDEAALMALLSEAA